MRDTSNARSVCRDFHLLSNRIDLPSKVQESQLQHMGASRLRLAATYASRHFGTQANIFAREYKRTCDRKYIHRQRGDQRERRSLYIVGRYRDRSDDS